MTKWEYRTIRVHGLSGNLNWMDEMGREGWELTAVDEGVAYFRRPKKECIPVRVGPSECKEAPYV